MLKSFGRSYHLFQPRKRPKISASCMMDCMCAIDGNGSRRKPRLVICCEFAAMHKAATEAERLASGLHATSRGQTGDFPPRLGDRIIHKEIRSLVKQIEMSMAVNRRADGPFELHITSWGPPDSDIDVFGQFLNMTSWPITRHGLPLLEIFSAQEVRAWMTDQPW